MQKDARNQPGIWLPAGFSEAPEEALAASPSPRLRGRLRHAFQSTVSRARQGAGALLDTVYPPSCLACRSATAAHDSLCPQCWSQMRLIEKPYCERLGTPFAFDTGGPLVSPAAFANPPAYFRARAVACFGDGPVRDLVHRLKYGDRVELARPMGHWMARAGAYLLVDADLLIPVPLHWKRLFSRRFNQAALLAKAISTHCDTGWNPHVLRRVRPTPPQVGKSRAQRADNVQGAFQVADHNRSLVSDKRLVLVDDVLTSGATANAAARVLLRAGAAQVDVLIFARVVQDL